MNYDLWSNINELNLSIQSWPNIYEKGMKLYVLNKTLCKFGRLAVFPILHWTDSTLIALITLEKCDLIFFTDSNSFNIDIITLPSMKEKW
jgi:hypothetical protein